MRGKPHTAFEPDFADTSHSSQLASSRSVLGSLSRLIQHVIARHPLAALVGVLKGEKRPSADAAASVAKQSRSVHGSSKLDGDRHVASLLAVTCSRLDVLQAGMDLSLTNKVERTLSRSTTRHQARESSLSFLKDISLPKGRPPVAEYERSEVSKPPVDTTPCRRSFRYVHCRSLLNDRWRRQVQRGITLALATVLAMTLCEPLAASDWPMMRRTPDNRGVAAEVIAPPLRRAWVFDAKGAIEGTPAVVGGRVYVPVQNGKLFALRLSDGKQIWQADLKDPISASPCVWEGRVFIGTEEGTFYALSADTGKVLWKHSTGDKIVSSAVPYGGNVLVGSYDNHLYCFRRSDGRVVWSFKAQAQVHATPCVVGNYTVIAGCDGHVRVIDLRTGKERTSLPVDANFGAPPAALDGTVLVGSLSGIYLRMRVHDGKAIWRVREKEDGAAVYAGAAVTGQVAVFGSRSARVLRLDPANGTVRWTFRTKGQVNSSPVISGTTVYVGCDDGHLYAIDLATGRERWKFRAGGEIKSGPVVAGGRVLVGTMDGSLYCFVPAAPGRR